MISLRDFQKKSIDSGLTTEDIASLYGMMKSFCVLCVASQKKAGERATLFSSLRGLLNKSSESKNSFLRSILADFLRVEIDQKIKENGVNRIFILDTDSLNKIGNILQKHLEWTEKDSKNSSKTVTEVHQRNKEDLGSKSWKRGLLAGVIAIVAAGTGYAIYKHTSNNEEEGKK